MAQLPHFKQAQRSAQSHLSRGQGSHRAKGVVQEQCSLSPANWAKVGWDTLSPSAWAHAFYSQGKFKLNQRKSVVIWNVPQGNFLFIYFIYFLAILVSVLSASLRTKQIPWLLGGISLWVVFALMCRLVKQAGASSGECAGCGSGVCWGSQCTGSFWWPATACWHLWLLLSFSPGSDRFLCKVPGH